MTASTQHDAKRLRGTHRAPRHRDGLRRWPPKPAAFAAEGNKVYPFHLGDMNLPTPENIVEAAFKAVARRQDRLLPQRRHPAAARRAGRRRGRLARPRPTRGERRRPARRQADDRQVHPRPHEPRRRGALPQPRLPDLRVADRVPRRRGACPTATSRAATDYEIDLDGTAGRHHAAHPAAHSQRPAEPPGRGAARRRSARRSPRSSCEHDLYGALRRGLLRHPLQRRQPFARLAAGHGRTHASCSTRSRRSSP